MAVTCYQGPPYAFRRNVLEDVRFVLCDVKEWIAYAQTKTARHKLAKFLKDHADLLGPSDEALAESEGAVASVGAACLGSRNEVLLKRPMYSGSSSHARLLEVFCKEAGWQLSRPSALHNVFTSASFVSSLSCVSLHLAGPQPQHRVPRPAWAPGRDCADHLRLWPQHQGMPRLSFHPQQLLVRRRLAKFVCQYLWQTLKGFLLLRRRTAARAPLCQAISQ